MKRIALWAALVLVGGSLALAQAGPPTGGGRGSETLGAPPAPPSPPAPPDPTRLVEALDLTDEQADALYEILDRYRGGELFQITRAMHQARQELDRLVHDPTAAESQVLDAARAVSTATEEVALLRHGMAVEIDGLLTEEQREQFRELRASQEQGNSHGRDRRGPRRHR